MPTRIHTVSALSTLIETAASQQQGRLFVAIVGAPGSGKSTITDQLLAIRQATHPGETAILAMDGFHYDDAILTANGRRPWKGAPDTFDVGGLKSILQRLADPGEGTVAVPVFDRKLEVSRGSARLIPPQARLILVEGNYLLLDQRPWSELASCFDLSVMIDVPEAELEHRLRQRWQSYQLNTEEITRKLEENDMPNGRLILRESRPADVIFTQRERQKGDSAP